VRGVGSSNLPVPTNLPAFSIQLSAKCPRRLKSNASASASIVDTVLAELKPKLMEETAKKLKK